MAIKRTLDRCCETCGGQQVFDRDDGMIGYQSCNNSKCRPPGPFNPAKIFRLREVIINENQPKRVRPTMTDSGTRESESVPKKPTPGELADLLDTIHRYFSGDKMFNWNNYLASKAAKDAAKALRRLEGELENRRTIMEADFPKISDYECQLLEKDKRIAELETALGHLSKHKTIRNHWWEYERISALTVADAITEILAGIYECLHDEDEESTDG